MSDKEADKWLKAVLNGKIRPGDEQWKRIWQEDDLGELRRAMKDIGAMRGDEVAFNQQRVWEMIEKHSGEMRGKSRSGRVLLRRATAVAAVVLVAVGAVWLMRDRTKELPLAQVSILEPGTSRAYLETAHGQRIDLATVASDTVITHDGIKVHLGSSRSVVYESTEEMSENMGYNTMSVPRQGEWNDLRLDDGTRVWINSESVLSFPSRFTGSERRVLLKGEAFFDVAPNAAKPFIVETAGVDIRVRGTRFNVNAYIPERAILTTVESGSVQVVDRDSNKSVNLTSGLQGVWKKGSLTMREVDVATTMAWIDGKFYFEEGATLEEIAEQMERWYDFEFEFADDDLKMLCFAGVIKKAKAANEILASIEKTTRVNFTVRDRVVIVTKALT